MGYIDIKEIIWIRCYVQDEDLDFAISNYKDTDQIDWDLITESETLYETSEHLSPDRNCGNSTVEIYNDDGEMLYENGRTN